MLRVGELSNPQPSRGQNTPFGPRPGVGPRRTGGSGAPNFQEFMNPNLHNSHGRTSNPTVSYPFLTRPFRFPNTGSHPVEGEMIFTHRDQSIKAGSGLLITAMPLTFLNVKFCKVACEQTARSNGNNLNTALSEINNESLSPGARKKFACKFNFLGVMRNESQAPSRHQKLINVDVRGRTRIRNVWRGKLRTGEKLYLHMQLLEANKYGSYKPSEFPTKNDVHIFRLTPVTLTEIIVSKETKNKIEESECIFIGVCMNTVHKKSSEDQINSSRIDTKRLNKLDFIEVALKVSR